MGPSCFCGGDPGLCRGSLTDALTEIGGNYEQSSGDEVFFNFAASNLLARQIQEGAPADLFISADEEKMDSLEKKNMIIKKQGAACFPIRL